MIGKPNWQEAKNQRALIPPPEILVQDREKDDKGVDSDFHVSIKSIP